MTEPNPLDLIFHRLLDDREHLSDEEFLLLLEALRTQPQLAERLKDHLIMDELLAQQYAMDRKDFIGKFEQLLQQETTPKSKPKESDAEEPPVETYALRWNNPADANGHSLAVGKNGSSVAYGLKVGADATKDSEASKATAQTSAGSPAHPWLMFFAVMAGLLLVAGGLFWLEFTPAARKLGEVNEVSGIVLIYRNNVGIAGAAGMPILPGDDIRSQADAELTLTFRDQSRLTIGPQSQVIIQPDTGHLPGIVTAQHGKQIFVQQGTLDASIEPQPPGQRLRMKTPQIELTVLGTRFKVAVNHQQSQVEVIEGIVEVETEEQTTPPIELEAGYRAVVTKTETKVSPGDWPVKRDGLIFLLRPTAPFTRTPNQGMQLFAEGQDHSKIVLRPRSQARFERGKMVFHAGAFLADDQAAADLLARCQTSNQLTLETTFQAAGLSQTGPARWITFSTSSAAWNFSLAQEGQQCILRLLTGNRNTAEQHELPLCEIPDLAPHHLAVTYTAGRLACYLDGTLVSEQTISGTFAPWTTQHLLFGDEWNGNREWQGSLSGVAIYSRAISAEEVARNALHYKLRHGEPQNDNRVAK